jgi:hypothetical protein
MTDAKKEQIQTTNNQLLIDQGYTINEYLPVLQDPNLRPLTDIKGRIAILNAMINIAFEAPSHVIRDWIVHYKLTSHLSDFEQLMINKPNPDITELELNSLAWNTECLWALLWVVELVDKLDAREPVGENMIRLLPDLEVAENNFKVDRINNIRTDLEIYTMLDYYTRLHWCCEQDRIKGLKSKVSGGIVFERKKALEWVIDKQLEWDSIV